MNTETLLREASRLRTVNHNSTIRNEETRMLMQLIESQAVMLEALADLYGRVEETSCVHRMKKL